MGRAAEIVSGRAAAATFSDRKSLLRTALAKSAERRLEIVNR
jgi:hypothetical protein